MLKTKRMHQRDATGTNSSLELGTILSDLEIVLSDIDNDNDNDDARDSHPPLVSPPIEPIQSVNSVSSTSVAPTNAMTADINSSNHDQINEDSDYDTNCLSRVAHSPESVALADLQTNLMNQFYTRKWCKLFTTHTFYGRVLILILSVLLLVLSTAYCVAQLWDVKLDLVKKCDPKTHEQIWRHSYESGLVDGSITMTVESQYGHTQSHCGTTQSFDTNT
eukprot:447029_1